MALDLERRLEEQALQCLAAERECVDIDRQWRAKCADISKVVSAVNYAPALRIYFVNSLLICASGGGGMEKQTQARGGQGGGAATAPKSHGAGAVRYPAEEAPDPSRLGRCAGVCAATRPAFLLIFFLLIRLCPPGQPVGGRGISG